VAWPVAARAQQVAAPVVAYLYPGIPLSAEPLLAAMRKGLGELGFVDGRNVAIELHAANNDFARLQELLADLVRRRVAAIAVLGTAADAVRALNTSIPIVFSVGSDPVQGGLVGSLNRPGGNITGLTTLNSDITAKRVELMHELLPQATHIAALLNPNEPTAKLFSKDVRAAASAKGWQIEVLTASSNSDIDAAFASVAQKRADAVLVGASALFRDRRVQFAMLSVRYAMPAMYIERGFAEAGGLISYGASLLDQHVQMGVYVGRILKGEKPADLPVQQAIRLELVINLQTAKILSLAIPPNILAIADEVIE
jgi:putative ABC transport system substrate-binding protein